MTQLVFSIWIDTAPGGAPLNRLRMGGDCDIATYTAREHADEEAAVMSRDGFRCHVVEATWLMDEQQVEPRP